MCMDKGCAVLSAVFFIQMLGWKVFNRISGDFGAGCEHSFSLHKQ